MARARGANAVMNTAFETTYGTPPANGYKKLPFVSSQLGAERGLIESDLLGSGRAPFDPTPDVTNNDGDVVVPVDTQGFGHWLKLMFGAPATTEDDDIYTHVFAAGATNLPSMAIEIGHPDVPSFSTHYGAKGNTLQIAMQRSGLLNATIGLIAKGETPHAGATQAGAPTAYADISRFPQGVGAITRDGNAIASVVSANLSFSNALDKIETIRPDGEIEGADPGMPAFNGTIVTRFATHDLLDLATNNTPVEFGFGWVLGESSLAVSVPRVFLPRAKRPVTGPSGIQVTFNFQASGEDGPVCTFTLVNAVETY